MGGAGDRGRRSMLVCREAKVRSDSAAIEPVQRRSALVRRGLWVLALLALLYAAYRARELGAYVPEFAAWVEAQGAWGPLLFVAGYAVAVVAFIPGSVMTLAAGAVFGIAEGVLLVFIAATAGSLMAFVIARYVARGAVSQRIADSRRFSAVDRAIGEQGLKIVLLLRLSPVFPYNLLNYALGLTRVRFVDYAVGSVGMLPGTLLYVYYGKLVGDVAALAAGAEVPRGPGYWSVLVLGLVATVAVTAVITRAARRALRETAGEQVVEADDE